MYEHNALGYWSGLALCLTKVRSSRARCPATALILTKQQLHPNYFEYEVLKSNVSITMGFSLDSLRYAPFGHAIID